MFDERRTTFPYDVTLKSPMRLARVGEWSSKLRSDLKQAASASATTVCCPWWCRLKSRSRNKCTFKQHWLLSSNPFACLAIVPKRLSFRVMCIGSNSFWNVLSVFAHFISLSSHTHASRFIVLEHCVCLSVFLLETFILLEPIDDCLSRKYTFVDPFKLTNVLTLCIMLTSKFNPWPDGFSACFLYYLSVYQMHISKVRRCLLVTSL